jgi:SAM-dependent methyltransferase
MKYPLDSKLSAFLSMLDQRGAKAKKSAKKDQFFGWRQSFSPKECLLAKRWNSYYEAIVWGDHDDASNDCVQADEESLIRDYLKDSVYGDSVLEVGSGSGRVTECIVKNAKQVIALDREVAPLEKLEIRFRDQKIKTLCSDFASADFAGADFASTSLTQDGVSAVLLMENLAGMNPVFRDRKRIYQNAHSILKHHGLAVFAYRVDETLKGNRILNQVMPYEISNGVELFGRDLNQIYGFAMNWSKASLPSEVLSVCKGFEWVETRRGGSRPAGGRMYYGVFRKK